MTFPVDLKENLPQGLDLRLVFVHLLHDGDVLPGKMNVSMQGFRCLGGKQPVGHVRAYMLSYLYQTCGAPGWKIMLPVKQGDVSLFSCAGSLQHPRAESASSTISLSARALSIAVLPQACETMGLFSASFCRQVSEDTCDHVEHGKNCDRDVYLGTF